MRKVLLVAILVFALTGVAGATRGTWENLAADPNAVSSGFLAVSAVDENTLFTVGIEQTSSFGASYAWRSDDGGQTMTPILSFDGGSGNSCDLVNFFQFMIGGQWIDKDHGVTIGMAIPATCVQQHPDFPACLFECMFAITPYVWTVTDDGNTFTQHDINGSITKMVTAIKIVGNTIYVCGTNGTFLRSTDFGSTWIALPPPETGIDSEMDTMWWLDENVGYIGTAGAAANGRYDAPAPTSIEEALAMFDELRGRFGRLDFDRPLRDGAAASVGNLYKTTDGGNTWETIYVGGGQYSVSNVQMLDEMNGFMITDEWGGSKAEETILYTHDGGATWTKSTIPDTGPGNSKYIIANIRMITPSLGYAGAAYQAGIAAHSCILVTTDGGKTFAFDTIGNAPTYHGNIDGYGVTAMDFADNKRGFAVGMNMSVMQYTGTNSPPTANAGANQTVKVGDTVKLDGSKSSDPDGDALLYYWSELNGPSTADFSNAYIVNPTFVAAAAGEYHIQLQVSDIEYDATATVTITAVAAPADDDATDDDAADDDAADDDDDTAPHHSSSGSSHGGGCSL
jgi:photosystem II stability/assembly factor-like uncharacterized protein